MTDPDVPRVGPTDPQEVDHLPAGSSPAGPEIVGAPDPEHEVAPTDVASDPAGFEALLEFLRDHRGFDFTGYKRASVRRRVDRRLALVGAESYPDYVDHLQVDQDEFAALFDTMLINVTSFFRDHEAWEALQADVVPRILAARGAEEPIRIWSAGCASGQEAYGLAIIFAEVLGAEAFRRRVKIYATDVDAEALATARQAVYADKDLETVAPVWRERYFERVAERWVFRSDLRRCVIFGRNDLVQDAPIGRLDLLVCRNTLMYLNAETQTTVLRRFRFALDESGYLFLGKAETLLSHPQLFLPLDTTRRFFRPASSPVVPGRTTPTEPPEPNAPVAREEEALLLVPMATVLVSSEGIVSRANRRAEGRIGVGPRDVGRFLRDLDVAHGVTGLRSAVEEARHGRTAVSLHDTTWTRAPGEVHAYDVDVVPLEARDLEAGPASVAVYFSDVTDRHRLVGELEEAHRQVETAYQELQATVEELETTNEELQSTVEELETTNEELQSTNEELETMNEELQSTNDELHSMNDELHERGTQLDGANLFLRSVLSGLRSAVIVVDAELRVSAWNSRAEDLWGLRTDEVVGQHLLNLDIGLSVEALHPLLRETLAGPSTSREPMAVSAVDRRGRSIRLAISAAPLLADGDRVSGAVLLMDSPAEDTGRSVAEPGPRS